MWWNESPQSLICGLVLNEPLQTDRQIHTHKHKRLSEAEAKSQCLDSSLWQVSLWAVVCYQVCCLCVSFLAVAKTTNKSMMRDPSWPTFCVSLCVCVRMCSYMKCLSDRVGCVYSSVVEKGCRKPPGWMVSPLYPSFKPCVKTSNSPHLLYHISVVLINTVLYLFPHH